MTCRLYVIIFITTVLGVRVFSTMKPGGLSPEEKQPTPEVQEIINLVKPEVEARLKYQLPTFNLLSYKTQVVSGINYFAKVDIGEEQVVHLKVYRHWSGDPLTLTNLQVKGRPDPIEFF